MSLPAASQPLNLFPSCQCTAVRLSRLQPPPRGCTAACGRVVAGVVPVVVCRTSTLRGFSNYKPQITAFI